LNILPPDFIVYVSWQKVTLVINKVKTKNRFFMIVLNKIDFSKIIIQT
jgi:hypothetical protein